MAPHNNIIRPLKSSESLITQSICKVVAINLIPKSLNQITVRKIEKF